MSKTKLSTEVIVLLETIKYVFAHIGQNESTLRADSVERADSTQYTVHSALNKKETNYPQRYESRLLYGTNYFSHDVSRLSHGDSHLSQAASPNFDVDRLLRLAAIHKLRPVLLAYDKEYNILPAKSRQQLELQCVQIFAKNLRMVRLYHVISETLSAADIPVLPMKGNLFLSRYYQNQQIREIGDLDILIPPEYMIQATEVLREVDVVPEFGSSYNSSDLQKEYLTKRLESRSQCETKFRFQDIHVDVHWELTHPHYLVGLRQKDLFSMATKDEFFGKNVLMPDPSHTFWMLVAHHGGKENWTRLRHILDFALALEHQHANENSQNENYDIVISQIVILRKGARDLKLDQVFEDGCKLVELLTLNDKEIALTDVFSARHSAILVSFWENKHDPRSKIAIFNRQLLRYLRKSKSTNSFAFLMSYIRSVLSNRTIKK